MLGVKPQVPFMHKNTLGSLFKVFSFLNQISHKQLIQKGREKETTPSKHDAVDDSESSAKETRKRIASSVPRTLVFSTPPVHTHTHTHTHCGHQGDGQNQGIGVGAAVPEKDG